MSSDQLNLTQLIDTFQLIDKNKDGSISIDEFEAACQKLHMTIDKTQLHGIFDNPNKISFEDFCKVMQNFKIESRDKYFQETFHAFDKNSDGFITAKEIKQTMKELGEPLTDKQAKEMLKTADINGDGKLSQDEFRHVFNQMTQYGSPSSS